MSIPSTSSPAATPAVNGVGTVNGATKRSEEDLKAILGAATGEQRIQNDSNLDAPLMAFVSFQILQTI